ncbi:MAG: SigE family RNA polymerase sigma factor [Acidimicrobiales bacterium]
MRVGEPGFDEFYEGTKRKLLAQVYSACGDLGDAQDCLQDAYIRAWQRWTRINAYDNPEAWVRTVAMRLATNRWHKARSAVRAWTRNGPSRDGVEPSPDSVALVAGLRRLPWPQRQALVLHYIAGMPILEIAAETGVPESTVKTRLARGRLALAGQLSQEGH